MTTSAMSSTTQGPEPDSELQLDDKTINEEKNIRKDVDAETAESTFGRESVPVKVVTEVVVEDDFPDGGLRAWLVVLGVSVS